MRPRPAEAGGFQKKLKNRPGDARIFGGHPPRRVMLLRRRKEHTEERAFSGRKTEEDATKPSRGALLFYGSGRKRTARPARAKASRREALQIPLPEGEVVFPGKAKERENDCKIFVNFSLNSQL